MGLINSTGIIDIDKNIPHNQNSGSYTINIAFTYPHTDILPDVS